MSAPIRIPAGTVTPHGWWHIVNDTRPTMRLRAYDGSVVIELMGGLAPPYHDPRYPEAVALVDLKGLIPPWKHITQKGATEDGVTHIDALYDPIEVEMVVECVGRNPKLLRRTHRYLIDSIDAKQKSELAWVTEELGLWWADVRWFQGGQSEPVAKPQTRRQRVPLRLMADNGFWRTHDHADSFAFVYDSMRDDFGTDYPSDMGPNWPLYYYEGSGGGHPKVVDGQAAWSESGVDARAVVIGPYKDFDTGTNKQVVEFELGSFPEMTFQGGAYNDAWLRMNRNPDGTWAGDGVRARVGLQDGIVGWVELARFNNFVKTVMRSEWMFIPPWPRDKFKAIAGFDGDERLFKLQRNGVEILAHKEVGTGSEVGPDHRGVGLGLAAGAGGFGSQASPSQVMRVSAGDNAEVTQSGFLTRVNVGDQPMYDDHTLFGPFKKVKLYDGPGSDDYVEFGPLLANQVVFLRTDPRSQTTLVQDLTVIPPTPQQLDIWQDALNKFLNSVGFNNSALGDQIKSTFGILPPQGNLYKYLKGRFSDNAAIPPKSPGRPAEPYYVKAEIVGGNADSKIISSGTPLRRLPY